MNKYIFLLIFFSTFVSACGQSGSLTLPTPDQQHQLNQKTTDHVS